MKKCLIPVLLLSLIASLLAGCGGVSDQASSTVPWGAPASFEGAGVGLPQMDYQDD